MLISCPNCTTNFSVPDKALQPAGRTLKCAKCGHKWFQSVNAPRDDFGLDEGSFPPPPRPMVEQRPMAEPRPIPESRPLFTAPEPEPEPASFRMSPRESDLDLDEPPIPDFGPKAALNAAPPPNDDLDPDSAPRPVPEMFAHSSGGRKGTGFLWVVLVVLLLGAAAGAVYYFQDKVVGLWPPAHDLLTQAGLRHERPGAGLELRNAGTPERFVQNDVEVLIVRGIIANVSDRERPVPTMKLVLLDRDKAVVQEKQQVPPVTALDPGGTAGFRIILERPDPNAVEVNVLFVDPREAAK